MRICILSRDFLPNIGGIAAHVYELSKELIKQGNEVHLITFRKNILDKKHEELEGIKLYRIYLPRIRILGRLCYAFFETLKIFSIIKSERIDVIHSHSLIPDDLSAMFVQNRRIIITEHSSRFLRSVENWRNIRLNRLLLNHADHITGPSKELVDAFIKIGIKKEKISFIPNGVDINKFNPSIQGIKIKNKHNLKMNEKILLCPRRLVLKNGVKYLILSMPRIIAHFKHVKLLIVGDGPEYDNLKNVVKKLKIQRYVIFTLRIPYSMMPKYYAVADIVVLPSLKEATSIAGLEAMATGKPLIGTRVGGIPYLIENDKTGILVYPKNPREISEAVIKLLKDDSKRVSMGIKARIKAEHEFSWQIIARRFKKIYERSDNNF